MLGKDFFICFVASEATAGTSTLRRADDVNKLHAPPTQSLLARSSSERKKKKLKIKFLHFSSSIETSCKARRQEKGFLETAKSMWSNLFSSVCFLPSFLFRLPRRMSLHAIFDLIFYLLSRFQPLGLAVVSEWERANSFASKAIKLRPGMLKFFIFLRFTVHG